MLDGSQRFDRRSEVVESDPTFQSGDGREKDVGNIVSSEKASPDADRFTIRGSNCKGQYSRPKGDAVSPDHAPRVRWAAGEGITTPCRSGDLAAKDIITVDDSETIVGERLDQFGLP